jgi:hypothetical protein
MSCNLFHLFLPLVWVIGFLFDLLLPLSSISPVGRIIIDITSGCTSLFILTYLTLDGVIYKAGLLNMIQSNFSWLILGCLVAHYCKLLLNWYKVRVRRGFNLERCAILWSVLIMTVALPHRALLRCFIMCAIIVVPWYFDLLCNLRNNLSSILVTLLRISFLEWRSSRAFTDASIILLQVTDLGSRSAVAIHPSSNFYVEHLVQIKVSSFLVLRLLVSEML